MVVITLNCHQICLAKTRLAAMKDDLSSRNYDSDQCGDVELTTFGKTVSSQINVELPLKKYKLKVPMR